MADRRHRVTVTLPAPVLAKFLACADRRAISLAEYLRSVLIELSVRLKEGLLPEEADTQSLLSQQDVQDAQDASRVTVAASRYKGVYRYGKRWRAILCKNGSQEHLGVYDTPEEAARAYDNRMAAECKPNDSRTVNFPDSSDRLRDAVNGFIEKFVAGTMTDADWKAWQSVQSNFEPPRDPLEVPIPEPRAADEAEPDEREPEATTVEQTDPDEVFSDEVLPVLPVHAVPDDGVPQPLVARKPIPLHRKTEKPPSK
jgi:hypothetical protein